MGNMMMMTMIFEYRTVAKFEITWTSLCIPRFQSRGEIGFPPRQACSRE